MPSVVHETLFSSIPSFERFEGATDRENYRALPADWVLGLVDVVASRTAVEAGRYKDVNLAGVSAIAAVLNAVGHRDFPFTFGGDGSLIVLPTEFEGRLRETLAAVQVWVEEELDLILRVAVIPVAAIRSAGHDILVARYAVSAFVSYAMFSGGGARWADLQMKAGHFSIPRAAAGTRPDLSGLSCRWSPMRAVRGEILSVIVVPTSSGAGHPFSALVKEIIEITEELPRGGNPVAPDGPNSHVSPEGIDREIRTILPNARYPFRFARLALNAAQLLPTLLTKGHLLGQDARQYGHDVSNNSDFRKFDDALKLTIDTDTAHRERIEKRLRKARQDGIVKYGLHRQCSALVTCFVPAPSMRDHIHFIDGGEGGYAAAASRLAEDFTLSFAPRSD